MSTAYINSRAAAAPTATALFSRFRSLLRHADKSPRSPSSGSLCSPTPLSFPVNLFTCLQAGFASSPGSALSGPFSLRRVRVLQAQNERPDVSRPGRIQIQCCGTVSGSCRSPFGIPSAELEAQDTSLSKAVTSADLLVPFGLCSFSAISGPTGAQPCCDDRGCERGASDVSGHLAGCGRSCCFQVGSCCFPLRASAHTRGNCQR